MCVGGNCLENLHRFCIVIKLAVFLFVFFWGGGGGGGVGGIVNFFYHVHHVYGSWFKMLAIILVQI